MRQCPLCVEVTWLVCCCQRCDKGSKIQLGGAGAGAQGAAIRAAIQDRLCSLPHPPRSVIMLLFGDFHIVTTSNNYTCMNGAWPWAIN